MITVLTPTYNRAKYLERVYKSLLDQSDHDFEWLIVDDGSTDNTKKVVDKYIKAGIIQIRYFYKENGGKHTALNLGTREAEGELILILDSDDYLLKDAISNVNIYWKKYKDYPKICGMTFLKHLENPIVKEVSFSEQISNMNDFKYNRNIPADMCEVMSTEILRKYPYPEFPGEKFLSEVIVTGEIAKEYNLAYIPIEIYNAKYLDDGLSKNWMKLVVNNPCGARANNLLFMSNCYKFKIRLKNVIMFDVFSIIAHKKISESKMMFWSILFYIPSWFVAKYLMYKYKVR